MQPISTAEILICITAFFQTQSVEKHGVKMLIEAFEVGRISAKNS